MTEDEKKWKQENNMSLTAFYLDDFTKLKVLEKIKALHLDSEKGSFSATLRVLLKRFAASDEVDKSFVKEVRQEYLLSATKRKRSKL